MIILKHFYANGMSTSTLSKFHAQVPKRKISFIISIPYAPVHG
jgi:hypothetical protein